MYATKATRPSVARDDTNLEIVKIVLKGIEMGLAVIVMSTPKNLDVNTGVSMLSFGLTALVLANLQE